MPVNLVQTSDIEAFFLQQAEGDSQIAQWLEMALTKSLRRRPESAVELRDIPANAPGWLIYKWADGGPFHRFSPDPELVGKVGHIRDWLVAARADDAPFLRRKDDFGNPLKLHNLDLEAAFNAASKYFDRKSRKRVRLSDSDEETAMEFPDGFRVVALLTRTALEGEGKKMRHCVGSEAYTSRLEHGNMRFFSLRGPDGEPLATLSVRSGGELDQCKAWRDEAVAPECLPYLISFLTEAGISLRRFHLDLPGLFQEPDGKILRVGELPPSYTMRESMYVKRDGALGQLPERLFVQGSVHLLACPNLERIGPELTVTQDLILEDCHQLQELPPGIIVGQKVKIRACGLRSLPEIDVGWDIQLRDCWFLTRFAEYMRVRGNMQVIDCDNLVFPHSVRVGGWLDIESKTLARLQGGMTVFGCLSLQQCDALEGIGDRLTVTGDVYLGDCPKLKSLPKGMRVEGDLTIENCGIEALPDDLVVGGALSIRDCPHFASVGGGRNFRGPFEFRNCARLQQLPPLPPEQGVTIFGCPALGNIIPGHLLKAKYLRTDLFLDPEALNG